MDDTAQASPSTVAPNDADAPLKSSNIEEVHLPKSLKAWYDLQEPAQGWQRGRLAWEFLRPFFRTKCYDLYGACLDENGQVKPWILAPISDVPYELPCDRNGVYGCKRYSPYFHSMNARVWPARNRYDDDVVIKVISCGDEGANELGILQFLSSEPMRSHPDNFMVPVLEFLEYETFTFAVLPRWGDCGEIPLGSVRRAITFCMQVTQGLSFLHRHLIAHLDIASENILINHLGHHELKQSHSSFTEVSLRCPVRYGLIDFDCSSRFDPDVDTSKRLAARLTRARLTRAPETQEDEPFDPFAADVFQTAQMLLHSFYDLTGVSAQFLGVLRDMSREEPRQRISMAEAHLRIQEIQNALTPDDDNICLNTHWVIPGTFVMPPDDYHARELRKYLRTERLKDAVERLTLPTPNAWTGAKWVDEEPDDEHRRILNDCFRMLQELQDKQLQSGHSEE